MYKRILPFELGKIALLAIVILSLIGIGYGTYWLVWYLIQLLISPLPGDFILQIADVLPESLQKLTDLVHTFFLGTPADTARAACVSSGLIVFFGIVSLLLARWLLRLLEAGFKKRWMPYVLQEHFSEIQYAPKKRRSIDEPLCQIGLLSYIERYYTANRLEALYRGCWVAAEETVCGGVYLNNYTSHRIKARGLWVTIQLNQTLDGSVILESVGTKNRFTHQSIAKDMCQIEFDYREFADQFSVYSDSEEVAYTLLTRDIADQLLRILDRYPDLCVVYESDCVHFLVRRRSFDRRWEYLIPFCLPHLRTVANNLYGPLMDITDELMA